MDTLVMFMIVMGVIFIGGLVVYKKSQ